MTTDEILAHLLSRELDKFRIDRRLNGWTVKLAWYNTELTRLLWGI